MKSGLETVDTGAIETKRTWLKETDPCTRVRNNVVEKFLSLGTTLAIILQ